MQEYLAGETLHGLSNRHDLSRNLIRIWVEKAGAGALDQDLALAELLTAYEARIATLERLVGRQALEIEFLKGAQPSARSPRSGPTSVTAGPVACLSSGCALTLARWRSVSAATRATLVPPLLCNSLTCNSSLS